MWLAMRSPRAALSMDHRSSAICSSSSVRSWVIGSLIREMKFSMGLSAYMPRKMRATMEMSHPSPMALSRCASVIPGAAVLPSGM